MDDATVRQIKVEGEQGLKAAQVGRPDVAGQHFNKALNHAEDVKDDRTRRDELATLSILFDQCGFPDLCVANSKFLSILPRVAKLVALCGARSGRPCSASAGDSRPARRSRRRPFRGGRIRARQAPTVDPQSLPKAVAQSPFLRSRGRRPVFPVHAPGPVGPFRGRLQTVNAVTPPSSADTAEVSPAFLVQRTDQAGPQGPQPGRHCRRRRHETAEPDLGLSADRATDHPGLRYSHEQGRGAADSRRSVPAKTGLDGAVLAHGPWSREGQSLES